MKKNTFKRLWQMFFLGHNTSIVDPLFAWNISLALASLVLFGFMWWSYLVFNDIKDAELKSRQVQNVAPRLIDRTSIESIVNLYDARATKFDELIKTPKKLVDPSI